MFNFQPAYKGNFIQLPYSACPHSSPFPIFPLLWLASLCLIGVAMATGGQRFPSCCFLLILFPAVCVCVLWPFSSVWLHTCLVPPLCSRVSAVSRSGPAHAAKALVRLIPTWFTEWAVVLGCFDAAVFLKLNCLKSLQHAPGFLSKHCTYLCGSHLVVKCSFWYILLRPKCYNN